MKYFLRVFLIFLVSFSTIVEARIHLTSSLEWMAVDAPLIIRGVVTEVKTIKGVFPDQPLWDVQDVTIAVHETLKGDQAQAVTMRWLSSNNESADQWKLDGHERLFILKQGGKDLYGVDFTKYWILYGAYPYTPIDLVTLNKTLVASDMTVLKDANQILKIIQERVDQQSKVSLPIVPHPEVQVAFAFLVPNRAVQLDVPEDSQAYSELWSGSSTYLIVPADERYKKEAFNWIKSSDYHLRQKGAQILSAYPGKETVEALKSLLLDTGIHEETNGTGQTYKKYGVREIAYQALQRLGVEVSKPIVNE